MWKYNVMTDRVLRADDINAVIALVQRKKGYALGPASFARFFGVAAVPLEGEKDIALNLICREDEQNDILFFHLHKHLERSLLLRTGSSAERSESKNQRREWHE